MTSSIREVGSVEILSDWEWIGLSGPKKVRKMRDFY